MSDRVREHLDTTRETVRGLPQSGVLPPHYPTCLGCGPAAQQGYHLQVRRDGDDVVGEHVFEPRHSGAPGIAHGGAVATVLDDLLGFLLYVARAPGVTRHLEIEYLRPVLVGTPYALRGRLESRDGRKLWVAATCTAPDGTVVATARGLFIALNVSHFGDALGGSGPGTVAL